MIPRPGLAIFPLIDTLTEKYSEGEHKLEAMRAREEYFDRAGKVYDDDAELFESRMAAFLEWYVLERPFKGGPPPAVDVDSLQGRAVLSHVSLNDKTVEGMRHGELPVFSVQYHPEASPGPNDASYLFDRFRDLLEERRRT